MTLLTLTEVATMLKVSPRTVRRLPIPRTYIGGQLRYHPDRIADYVNSRTVGGAPVQIVTVAVQSGMQIEDTAALPLPTAPARLVKHRNPLYAIGGKR